MIICIQRVIEKSQMAARFVARNMGNPWHYRQKWE